jgi:hypothetical protein
MKKVNRYPEIAFICPSVHFCIFKTISLTALQSVVAEVPFYMIHPALYLYGILQNDKYCGLKKTI